MLEYFCACAGTDLNSKTRACLTNGNCLGNCGSKATKDNRRNCQVVNEKTLANEGHTTIIRYITGINGWNAGRIRTAGKDLKSRLLNKLDI